jgi:hypothetical protein
MRRLIPLLLAAGCAHSPVRGDIHQRGWFLVETAHISLRTDLDRDDAVARARALDRYWDVLAHLYDLVAPGVPPPQRRFSVIHLARCDDFDRISFNDNAGFVTGIDGEAVAVTCEERQDDVLIHELAHIFNHHHFARLPRWVDEGLATYYETLRVQNGRAVLGNFPSQLSRFWNRPGWLPSFTAIRRMSRDEFYDPARLGPNYFCAWKLVHLLNNTEPIRQLAFRLYLSALRAGTPDDAAWRESFRDVPDDELAEDFLYYQQRDRVNRLTTSYRWTEPPAPRVRSLRPGEAHVVWANLLNVAHEDQVAAQLELAAAADPKWPGLLYWRARLLHPRNEMELLRAYLAREPHNGRAWLALVSTGLGRATPKGYDPLRDAAPAALVALQDDVRKLVEHASDPIALNQVGWYFALRRNPNAGLNFALRAVQAEPSCGECWDTVGLLYFQAGKLDLAIQAQERAVEVFAENAPNEVVDRLRRFRAALRRRPPAESAR